MYLKRLTGGGSLFPRLWQLSSRHKSSAAQDAVRRLKPGDRLHGYTVEKIEEVPELFLTAVALNHDKTNAKHVHVAREDNNNTFSVAFRTTPRDSTGVPHILEHTTLCGSRRFPVRDPFFKMVNRSLATFMNALTASDWTMYPFSSQNRKDYNNLLAIYLDAVFHPELRQLDFSQEGWRLEHEDLNNNNSSLVFKGVVYNEMKGVFSSSQNIYAEALQNHLLPSHTYGVVSGGDPQYIPDLTWDQLKEFHKTHYHPSNSKFFTYGNFPLEDHLQYINNNYLQTFDKITVDTAVPPQPRWEQPQVAHISCQPDPMAPDPKKQTTTSVSYLLSDITDINEAATLSIVCALLVDGESSPFYQALLGANIGSDYAPAVGYNGYTKEGAFSVGLQGISSEDAERVQQIIADTIDSVIESGFEKTRIESLLHRIELRNKHQTSNFGLALCMTTASAWNHDGDAVELLKLNKIVGAFKAQLEADPQFLQKKVKQYFKDNKHKLTLTMTPDDTFEQQRQEKEKIKLQECISQLTPEGREQIYRHGQELAEKQAAVEDLSCLPTLKLSEIDRKIIAEPTELVTLDDVQVMCAAQPTNEVTYIRMMSFLDEVPEEMKLYVPLFTSVITKMGAGVYDYKELSQEIELYTGGLNASAHVAPDPRDFHSLDQGVVFSSHCLERNLERMFELWTEIFDRSNMRDTERLVTLIRMTAAELAASLANSGHSYAMTHSASSLSPSAKLGEMFGGLTQVSIMKRIAEAESQSKMMEHLVEIGHQILNRNNLKVMVNATPDFMPTALKGIETFVKSIHSSRKPREKVPTSHTTHVEKFTASPKKTHIELPFSVNYMSKSVQTVPYTHEDFSVLRVLSRVLTWKYLHREIREKGGAYGSGAQCGSGVFSFFSYRDPNSLQTLTTFDDAVTWAADGGFSDEDIDEAKLSVFQQIDKPVAPGQVGISAFLNGVTDEMRQEARDRLFAVSRSQMLDVINRYLVPGASLHSTSFLGPHNDQVSQDQDWKILKE